MLDARKLFKALRAVRVDGRQAFTQADLATRLGTCQHYLARVACGRASIPPEWLVYALAVLKAATGKTPDLTELVTMTLPRHLPSAENYVSQRQAAARLKKARSTIGHEPSERADSG